MSDSVPWLAYAANERDAVAIWGTPWALDGSGHLRTAVSVHRDTATPILRW